MKQKLVSKLETESRNAQTTGSPKDWYISGKIFKIHMQLVKQEQLR